MRKKRNEDDVDANDLVIHEGLKRRTAERDIKGMKEAVGKSKKDACSFANYIDKRGYNREEVRRALDRPDE